MGFRRHLRLMASTSEMDESEITREPGEREGETESETEEEGRRGRQRKR